MDNKIYAIIAVAVIAVAAAGVAFVYLGDDDDKEEMDYSILDDPQSSVKLRLAIHIVNEEVDTLVRVTEVAGDTVHYNCRTILKLIESDEGDPEDLSMLIPFDFRDQSKVPQGITVVPNSGSFEINGSAKQTFLGIKFEMKYEHLRIVLEGETLKSIDGKAAVSAEGMTLSYSVSCTFETVDSKMKVKDLYMRTDEAKKDSVEKFREKYFEKFDPLDYAGCIITDGEPEEYYGKECAVKVINGVNKGDTYSEYKVFIYNGFVVKETGSVNGTEHTTTVRYYYV